MGFDIAKDGKFPRQIVLHVFANLNDCMVSNTWQMKHRLKDEDMYDLV
jgi:hypothetical protein